MPDMTVISKGPYLSEPEPQSPASGCESIGIKALLSSRVPQAGSRGQEPGEGPGEMQSGPMVRAVLWGAGAQPCALFSL